MINCDAFGLKAAVELFAPGRQHGEVRPSGFFQLERVVHKSRPHIRRLWREGVEHFLLRGGQRVGTHDDIGRDCSTTVYDSAGVRSERRSRTTHGISLEGIRHHFHELTAGEKLALLLDGAAVWSVPLRRRHLESVTTFEREHGLHETLSKGCRADNEGAVVILESAGNDLRCRSAPSIREQDERKSRGDWIISGDESLVLTVTRADARDLLTLLQEEIADAE